MPSFEHGGRVRDAAQSAAFASPEIQRIDTCDADDLAERVKDWQLEYTQLHPGSFIGSVVIVPLGRLLICRGSFNQPLVQHVSPPPGCLTVSRPGRGSGPLLYRGRELAENECFVLGSATDAEAVNRGLHIPTTLSMRLDIWETESHWLSESSLSSTEGVSIHAPGPIWTAGFLDAMEWILDATTRYPHAIARAELRNRLADSLLARVNALGDAAGALGHDRDMHAHRRLAVERAQEYIRVNLTEPMRLSDLCQHARTQARSLEYGFQEAIGMSPMTYVKTVRLHRVRKLLRSTAVRIRSVSEVALDCGFWHLSQFAVDYKQLFGESPSITCRRTLAQLPREQRRRQPLADAMTRSKVQARAPAGSSN